jgi:DNA invertase Pin-like site-specific DNA recombinase
MQVVIYSRVSTPGQDTTHQKETVLDYCRVRGFDVVRGFEDTATGANTDRPSFQAMLAFLRGGYADAVVVYKLDRLGRSLRDLLAIVDELNRLNIGFVSFSDNIDTTTSNGRLFFHILASLSEYERDLIRDRCSAGKTRAIANGVRFGRPRKKIDIERVMLKVLNGVPKTRIAQDLKVSYRCLTSRIAEYKNNK